jgi:carbonic anhydrase
MAILRVVAQAGGGQLGLGWNLIVLHHTDCGTTRLTSAPELLAGYLGVAPADLDALAIRGSSPQVVDQPREQSLAGGIRRREGRELLHEG